MSCHQFDQHEHHWNRSEVISASICYTQAWMMHRHGSVGPLRCGNWATWTCACRFYRRGSTAAGSGVSCCSWCDTFLSTLRLVPCDIRYRILSQRADRSRGSADLRGVALGNSARACCSASVTLYICLSSDSSLAILLCLCFPFRWSVEGAHRRLSATRCVFTG